MNRKGEEGKAAYNAYMREYRKGHRERMKQLEHDKYLRQMQTNAEGMRANRRAWMRKHRHENPEQARNAYIRQSRGITAVQYDAKLAYQNNLCALCGKSFDKSAKDTSPCLDHNHGTGQLRDFIHERCNKALGMFQDSPELCRKAAEYLERHSRG